MKILFLTLARIQSIEESGIYSDLLRKFRDMGHIVNIVCPSERKYGTGTTLVTKNNVNILNVWTPNIQKTNIIEKGITTLTIEYFFKNAIKKFIKYKDIDLILYSTPPITLTNLIKSLKKITCAKTYLLLKDIFPQNAVDLNLLKHGGILYKYFRNKEKFLYEISDYIGCMSPANLRYILKNNPEIDSNKVEVNPNSVQISNKSNMSTNKSKLYKQYNIPADKVIFIFGGNLGVPQGINFLKENISFCSSITNAFFLIIGNGTEYEELKKWTESEKRENVSLIKELPKLEYEALLKLSHVGLIFLNPLFSIPNFPSRLLSYMHNKMPVICATDLATDIGRIAHENNFGFNCLASDKEKFYEYVVNLLDQDLRSKMGENAYRYLEKEYSVDVSYNKIIEKTLMLSV